MHSGVRQWMGYRCKIVFAKERKLLTNFLICVVYVQIGKFERDALLGVFVTARAHDGRHEIECPLKPRVVRHEIWTSSTFCPSKRKSEMRRVRFC